MLVRVHDFKHTFGRLSYSTHSLQIVPDIWFTHWSSLDLTDIVLAQKKVKSGSKNPWHTFSVPYDGPFGNGH